MKTQPRIILEDGSVVHDVPRDGAFVASFALDHDHAAGIVVQTCEPDLIGRVITAAVVLTPRTARTLAFDLLDAADDYEYAKGTWQPEEDPFESADLVRQQINDYHNQ